jgi:hypothetical protein
MLIFIFGLKEGLGKDTTLFTLILPFLYTISVGFFWFLLPSSILTRLPVIFLFGVGMYALFLTMNIYTVSAIRTIALFRAAKGVGFVLTLFTFFLIFDNLFSVRLPIFIFLPSVLVISLPMFLQGFWSISLEKYLDRAVLRSSIVSSLIMGEMAACIYFWPVTVSIGSLFLTLSSYVLLGLGQSKLEGRLFKQTVKDYVLIGFVLILVIFLFTSWSN